MTDGNLKFDTKIDTDGFSKGVNTLKNSFNNLKSTIRGTGKAVDDAFSGRTSSKVVDLNGKIEQTESQIKSLRAEMEKMANTPFVSKEADTITGQVEKAEQQLLSLLNQREQLEEGMASGIASLGLPQHSPETMQGLYQSNTEWQKLTDKISQAEIKLSQYESKLKDVQQADSKVASTGTQEYTKKEQELQKLNNSLDVYKTKLAETIRAEQKKASSAKSASKSTDRLSRSMKKADKTAIPLTKSILKLSSMFKLMLMRMAIRATIDAVRDGFQNLAQVSDQVNADLSLLKSSLTQLKNSFATAFAPILHIVTPILNGLIQTLRRATDAVAQFFAILSGKDTYIKAVEVQEDYAQSLGETGKQAKKTAKELKNITGIDDVTILQDKSDTGAGAGGGGGIAPEDMFDEVAVNAKFAEMVDRFKEKLGEIATVIKESFKEGFKSGLGEVNFDEIRGHAQNIKKSLSDIFTDGDVKKAAKNWLENVSYALGETTGSFASMGLTIAELVLGSMDKYLDQNSGFIKKKLISIFTLKGESALIISNLMKSLADIFTVFKSDDAKQIGADLIAIFSNSFLEILELGVKFGKDIISAIAQPITDNEEGIKKALENTLKIIKDWTTDIKEFIGEMFESVQENYDKYISPALESFGNGFSMVFEAVLDAYNKYFAPALAKVSEKMRELMKGPMGDMIRSFMELVGKVVSGVADIWNKTLAPFIAWIIRTFGPTFSVVFGNIGSYVADFLGVVFRVIGNVFDILGGLVDFIAGVFTGDWSRAWNGIKAIFGGIWDSLVTIAKRPINAIIDLINSMLRGLTSGMNAVIRSLNRLSVKIPNWVPEYGGRSFGINIGTLSAPRIPRLATGTVVPANYGEFMAILGDNRREAEVVSPLSTMKQAMKEALRESGYSTNNGTTVLKVYLEGRQIYEEVLEQNNANTRRTGENAFAT